MIEGLSRAAGAPATSPRARDEPERPWRRFSPIRRTARPSTAC